MYIHLYIHIYTHRGRDVVFIALVAGDDLDGLADGLELELAHLLYATRIYTPPPINVYSV